MVKWKKCNKLTGSKAMKIVKKLIVLNEIQKKVVEKFNTIIYRLKKLDNLYKIKKYIVNLEHESVILNT